jgi:hypothetical protein
MKQTIHVDDSNLEMQLNGGKNGEDTETFVSRCSTQYSGCAGKAFFSGFPDTRSFRIYFGNGTESNSTAFVLKPNERHSVDVKSGDSYAWVYGNIEVPKNTQRSWIAVE